MVGSGVTQTAARWYPTVTNLASGLTGTLFVGNGAGSGDFDDIYLQVEAIPEPSTMVLMGFGACLVLWRGRRKARN